MSGNTKGLHWTDKEIEAMLVALFDISAGSKVMTSTNMETTSLFEKVSDIMKVKGFERSYSQIKAKFKKEKSIFYEEYEQEGKLPPKENWGPRFPFLVRLWEQAGKPDPRHRRPAACAKPRKHFSEASEVEVEGEPSSSTIHATPETLAKNTAVNLEDNDSPGYLVEGRKPNYDELVDEVLSQKTEIIRLKNSQEFMRQGMLRLRNEFEKIRNEVAVIKQAEELDSEENEEGEKEDGDGDEEEEEEEEM